MITQVHDNEMEFPFDSLEVPAMIVVMGLPFTRTNDIASGIGRWARCPILIIDDFLDSISEESGYNEDSLPSTEEAERLHRLAFDPLCRVARRHLEFVFSGCKCVVVKSPRICSTYELQRLFHLALQKSDYRSERSPLIFVESRFGNEYLWKENCLHRWRKWYEPSDWKEIEKAKEDYNAQAFDDELLRLLNNLKEDVPPLVRRLVVDPHYNLNIPNSWRIWWGEITRSLKFLLTAGEEELRNEIPHTVELRKLRIYLMEKKIAAASTSTQRSKHFCVGGRCVFKYWESLELESCCCGVCEGPLVLGEPGYSCYFCVLAMHKSCAEMPHFKRPASSFLASVIFNAYIHGCPERHACKSCIEAGRCFSVTCASCQFQTHLKSRTIPTVISNPDFHEHMISLRFGFQTVDLSCKGCGRGAVPNLFPKNRYGCSICETYYHPYCAFWRKELKHKHGGHEHVIKLMLSHDVIEEEGYWCDHCYRDIDPQVWFYSCQHCPYYMAQLHCMLRVP